MNAITMKCFISVLFMLAMSQVSSFSQKIEYSKSDSISVERILADAVKGRQGQNRMLYFGKKFIGVPYVANTLEKGNHEHLIVNLRELDCTTFVETVAALSLCDAENRRKFSDFCRNLLKLRYFDGNIVDYSSRLHYFTWWAEENDMNKGLIREITSDSYPFTAVQKVSINYMSAHPDLYKHLKGNPNMTKKIAQKERSTYGKTYRYIPKSLLNEGKDRLGIIHTGDIVAIVTSKSGLDTSHIGIAVWQNGKLHLLNASSIYKKVVFDKSTFYQYSQRQKSQLGIRVFRLSAG